MQSITKTLPRALILDYGNVLSLPQPPEIVTAMAVRVGVSVESFTAAYWEHRRGYDAGTYPADEYWRRVLGSLGRAPERAEERGLPGWLAERDAASWMRYRDEVWTLAREARGRSARTAMLTNMSREIADRIRAHRPLDAWFDAVIVSAEVGLVKPDERIYALCLARLDAAPPQALFVDDRPENVAAAARLGMRTVYFAGTDPVADLRAALRR